MDEVQGGPPDYKLGNGPSADETHPGKGIIFLKQTLPKDRWI